MNSAITVAQLVTDRYAMITLHILGYIEELETWGRCEEYTVSCEGIGQLRVVKKGLRKNTPQLVPESAQAQAALVG